MLTAMMIVLGLVALGVGWVLHAVASCPAGQMFAALFGGWADQCRHGPELGRDG